MKFKSKFYMQNRERLGKSLSGELLVIPANSALQKSADIPFPFEQDKNFWYLTGLNIADAVLTLDGESGEAVLYLPDQNDYQKEWDGEINRETIEKVSGISEIRFKADLKRILKQAKKQGRSVGYLPPLPVYPSKVEPYGFYANPARAEIEKLILAAGYKKDELQDIRKDIARLRMVKRPEEIAAIQVAIDATGASLAALKENLSSFNSEKELERSLIARFYQHGADGEAFTSIIASGKNAATIHYEDNDAQLQSKDLVLLDVGAEVDGYAADISRTWAIGGSPSKRQSDLWDACLDIQDYAFSKLKAGVVIREYQKDVEAYAQKVLEKLHCSMADKPFPHGFSHHLGLDVHDAGVYDEPLPENAVITVEPGIYLPDESIGMRVEDNIVITKKGFKNLSESIPKML